MSDKQQDPQEQEWEGPSKSARKRAAKLVEGTAAQLADLPEADWIKLPAPEDLRREISLARQTKGGGARKRQIKHLAGILRRREDDLESLQAFLDGLHQQQYQEKKDFHFLEQLRDRICDPEHSGQALDEAAATLPGVDRKGLARLANSVHASKDRKAYREIFRRLKNAWEEKA